MKIYLSLLRVGLLLAGTLCCGCCNVTPDKQQIEAWVRKELPSGSSETEVKKFSAAHHFSYERNEKDKSYAQAYRSLDGCDWAKPVGQIEMTYDNNDRLVEATVRVFSIGLP
jgi:hypothetical protein